MFTSIKEDDHAIIEWKTTLDLLMKEEYQKSKKCEYSLGIEEFFTERVALGFPIGNPWISKFDERLAHFLQSCYSYLGHRVRTHRSLLRLV